VVSRLRDAGAVIVGVAATDSGAFGVTTPQVMNPAFAGRIVGGSSGGSAAAVAAGFCKAAIGTDTGGSIRIPAACCGIVGFKPTRGRVSALGVRPLAASVDHVGPLAASVADVRAVMEVIDPGFSVLPVGPRERPIIVGVPRSYFADACSAVHEMIEAKVAALIRLGCDVRDIELPTPGEIIPTHLVLSLTEAALFHARSGDKALDSHPEAAREGILLGRSYSGSEHLQAQEHKREFVKKIDAVFGAVDFLLLPTLPVETPDRNLKEVVLAGSQYSVLEALIRYTAAFDHSGHPVIAMPWRSPALATPGSFQLVGPLDSDNVLLDFAEAVEMGIQN
jgi:Asp-tRNA(Asn)/Glu-tRNA(Gln) amidotransferase A subunit family amidase